MMDACKRNVLVLYVGGTIGMKPNQSGVLVPVRNAFVDQIKLNPALNDPNLATLHFTELEDNELVLPQFENFVVKYKLVEYEPLLDSSNMGASDWIRIAKDIEQNYEKFDGFVVLHGTDTLTYTSSALSFMLDGLKKPVILTGSQISVFECRSDAINNILQSLILSGCYRIPEVAIFFGNNLLRGNRATKVSTDQFRAYESPNFKPLATTEVRITVNEVNLMEQTNQPFRLNADLNTNIRLVRFVPTLTADALRYYLKGCVKGVVLETYGGGNFPSQQPGIVQVLKETVAKDVLVINITACLQGSVVDHYESGRVLNDIGVISGCDMTTEAALTKLMVVLNFPISYSEKVKIMKNNIKGELTTNNNPSNNNNN